jgi:hypothetical protein
MPDIGSPDVKANDGKSIWGSLVMNEEDMFDPWMM